ncbi:major facilitator superfamily domain-containing protein [Xylariaceae sp. FL0255]|nr:major facilitator superfamily domain-containing protein [Xylariaceae sp. FL0255]
MNAMLKLAARDDKPPNFWQVRSSKWFAVAVVSLATFTDVFLNASIVPVVPFALTNRAQVAPADVQHWTAVLLAINGAALVAVSPIAGWAADHLGQRRLPMVASLVALLASSLLLCFGRSVAVYIVARVLLGVSGAVVWTVGFALIVDSVAKAKVGKYLGFVFMSINGAVLVAPLIGGAVYSAAGYYAVFYINFGLIAIDIVLRLVLIEKKYAVKWMKEDEAQPPLPPAAAEMAESKEKAACSEESGDSSPSSPQTSRKGTTPKFVPIFSLLRSPRVVTALFGCLVQSTLFSTFDTVLPLRVHDLFGWNSLGAGLIFLALLIPSFGSPVVGWGNDRLGPKWIACIGFLLCAPALILLRFVDHGGIRQVVLLSALLAIIGFGVNFIAIPLAAEISYAIEANERLAGAYGSKGAYAQGYALLNTGFAAGSLIGPVWSGYVVTNSGWGTLGWSLGLLCALTTIPIITFTGGHFVFNKRGGAELSN